jgi:hypothetical protein
MSDTTPTPRSDEPTPLADETARELGTGEQPLTTSSDPADHTDTGVAPTLPPDYRPVSASEHVAPEPALPATDEQAEEPVSETHQAAHEPGTEPRFDAAAAGAEPETAAAAATPVPPLASEPIEPTAAHESETASETATEPEAEATTAPPVAEPTPTPAPAPVATPAAPAPNADAYAGPTYLQTPERPKKRGNRGLGILIAVLAAVVFAAADLAATYGILLIRYGDTRAADYLASYAKGWDFWVPLAVFTAAFIALVAIVNRARWWAYVLGAVFVAILVFASYYGAALLTSKAWNFTPGEFREFTRDYFESNITYLWVATAVTFIALEVVTWFGAWIAFHGQIAKRRNAEARAAYEEELEQSTSR